MALPNLFHFFLLSAVVHPAFIEGLDFYPSAYPAEFGRYTGGIISAHTATGRTDHAHGELSVDLVIPMIGLLKRKAERRLTDTALKDLKKWVEG